MVATDCGVTTFFSFLSGANWRFCGTSAAAPHAAGVAALLLDAETASPDEIRDAMLAGATPLAGASACAQGAGLVNAVGAIEELGSAGAVEPACAPPVPIGSAEEAQEPGDWGSEAPPKVKIDGGEVVTDELQEPLPSLVAPAAAPEPPGDRTAPRTGFRRKPPRVLLTRWRWGRAVFRFRSNEAGVVYLCQFDRKRYRKCGERFVRWFLRGRHVLRVKARDAAGNVTARRPSTASASSR